jgi:prepilin-type N-terminal cleavage/methylation domain-containing protein
MFFTKQIIRSAFTLVEVMVTSVVLCIIAIGSLNFQYYATRDSKMSLAQISATRIAQLLLEDWMSTGGSEDYDPASLGLGFSPIEIIPPKESDNLGSKLRDTMFSVMIDESPLLVLLMSKDVSYDESAKVTLRQLCVYVSIGKQNEEENTTLIVDYIKPVILTTYVRLDAGGG